MKNSKSFRSYLPVLGVLCFSSFLIAAEIRTATTVLNLKKEIVESQAATERATSRAGVLINLIGQISEEMGQVEKLPVALAPNAESLATAVENCAMAAHLSCVISEEGEKDGKVSLNVSCRASAQELLTFLRGLLARSETFFVSSLECRSVGDGLNVQLRLSAFVKTEAR